MIIGIKFFVINCLGYQNEPNAYDLLIFGLGSFVLISILLFYYNSISKSNNSSRELENTIYQSKDVLLQSNNSNINLIITQSTTSIWGKALVLVLIAFVIIVPVDKLIGAVNSFY
ncbi:hypothetical protein [Polaribacter sp. L3A8]|uniref:hypothetical protein n=1 Tax=Polaribacter sp. L3A8 TaxID=2686361 RepID=UPI00131D4046|nr:hypothetical protein [Polaribacter sp. L3A8]